MRNKSDHPLWHTYKAMLGRCYCAERESYKNYGGRGITVCQRWRDDFFSFVADLGPKPSPQHSIDRIDVNGNYEPTNCRWATPQEQAANRRDLTKSVTIRGETRTLKQWEEQSGIRRGVLERRISTGVAGDAILLPVGELAKRQQCGGKRVTLEELASRAGITKEGMRKRLKRGLTPEQAVKAGSGKKGLVS